MSPHCQLDVNLSHTHTHTSILTSFLLRWNIALSPFDLIVKFCFEFIFKPEKIGSVKCGMNRVKSGRGGRLPSASVRTLGRLGPASTRRPCRRHESLTNPRRRTASRLNGSGCCLFQTNTGKQCVCLVLFPAADESTGQFMAARWRVVFFVAQRKKA